MWLISNYIHGDLRLGRRKRIVRPQLQEENWETITWIIWSDVFVSLTYRNISELAYVRCNELPTECRLSQHSYSTTEAEVLRMFEHYAPRDCVITVNCCVCILRDVHFDLTLPVPDCHVRFCTSYCACDYLWFKLTSYFTALCADHV